MPEPMICRGPTVLNQRFRCRPRPTIARQAAASIPFRRETKIGKPALERAELYYVFWKWRCQQGRGGSLRPATVPRPMRRIPCPVHAQSRRAVPAPVRAACACPAPNCVWSRRAHRAGLRIRSGSGRRAGADRGPLREFPNIVATYYQKLHSGEDQTGRSGARPLFQAVVEGKKSGL